MAGETSAMEAIEVGASVEHLPPTASVRTGEVALQFGLPWGAVRTVLADGVTIPLGPGRIVLLLGPSGGGKTTLLGAIERRLPGGCRVERVRFDEEHAIVDQVAPGAPLGEALSILSACALGEPRLWLRRYGELSEGERFRARLAKAVGLHVQTACAAPLLCDEFCSNVHARAAQAISFNLRKAVTSRGLCLVVAATRTDIVDDLQPDVVVCLDGPGRCRVEERGIGWHGSARGTGFQPVNAQSGTGFQPVNSGWHGSVYSRTRASLQTAPPAPRRSRRAPRPSFARRMLIEPGCKADYAAFAAMHYKAVDELGFVDKVFVLRDKGGGEPLGIVVYAHPPLELALRNVATGGRFVRDATAVNRHIRILRRLVVHPDVRGCGLGHLLVERTLPLVGTRLVECLSSMGEINPVFEKAGMQRIGRYEPAADRAAALRALQALGVDPLSRAFPIQVARRPGVRRIVSQVVRDWYRSTTGEGESRVERQSAQFLAHTFRALVGLRPVYYLWKRPAMSKRPARRASRSKTALSKPPRRGRGPCQSRHDPRLRRGTR